MGPRNTAILPKDEPPRAGVGGLKPFALEITAVHEGAGVEFCRQLSRGAAVVIASELRDGMAVRIEGQVFKVLEVEVKAGGGQLGGVVKTKLRNVSSGRFWEPHFRPDERLEDLELERQTMEFIYSDADSCVFMNQNTYDQVEVPRAVVGPLEKFLEPGVRAGVEFFDGQAISIELPPVIEARVAETAPPIHSGQDNTWKFAKLENGVEIQVPLFVGPGEIVRIDVKSGRYLERVREKKRSA